MRNPSIHITKTNFEEILSLLEVNNFPTEAFFTMARKVAINSRVVAITANRKAKRVNNILLATKGDATLVADLIYAIRIKLKHKGVRKINQDNNKAWQDCKKLADICNTFCQDFNLETREGFIKYIETGLSRISSPNNLLTKLISMQETITNLFSAELELANDKYPYYTKDIHDYFVGKIADVTGIFENYKDQPEQYVHFLRLRKLVAEKGWNSHEFIDAQFEALAYFNSVPEPRQLYTNKAIERYNKYLYKNKDKRLLGGMESETSLWDKINEGNE